MCTNLPARGAMALALLVSILTASGSSGELPKGAYLVPNFHPACCGWLADWSTERNYCANTYLDHLDRIRDDPAYAFVLSEVPNMLAILQFEPGRFEELKRRIREGRVEAVNAFFLEPTINLSGGEALVKCGVEGLRWQVAVLGVRPRIAWMIDVTGLHEQMAQITRGLGLDALVYTRHNPTGSNIHWTESPDGSRVLTMVPGHYSEWPQVFKTERSLDDEQMATLLEDLRQRARSSPMSPDEILGLAREPWSGHAQRTPQGAPVLILGGSGDYTLAPVYHGYPSKLIKRFKELAPALDFRFSTLSKYLDAVSPGIAAGEIALPTMRGGTSFSFNAFWIQNLRAKTWFRRAEHRLQAAETLASAASLTGSYTYPVQPLYHAWLMMLLNMDRNSLWGAAGGMVFESERSWDVRDRYEAVEKTAGSALVAATGSLVPPGNGVVLFNPLNWERSDPVVIPVSDRQSLKGVTSQKVEGGLLCQPVQPSTGIVSIEVTNNQPPPPRPVALAGAIETQHYTARVDGRTGALVSLRLKPSGREVIGGPANVVLAERPRRQQGDPGDHTVDRDEREVITSSSMSATRISVIEGPVATIVVAESPFTGGGLLRRSVRFYRSHPRIDFDTELNDVPDRTVVVAEFPLAGDISEVRRGVPYGFSHASWSRRDVTLHGWAKGIVPAVRWSHYTLAQGGGVALLDRGASGRELTGRTPLIFLMNATDKYYGYPNSWLSGRGRHDVSYALVAHEGGWETARIPQLAWEYNSPLVVEPGRAAGTARSFLRTSGNVIVEAVRREGPEIEIRFAECFGRAGEARVELDLPHQGGARTDLAGNHPVPLPGGPPYQFAVRPQEIVTLRLRAARRVDDVQPLLSWEPLVPRAKREVLNTRINKKGHPPRGDAK